MRGRHGVGTRTVTGFGTVLVLVGGGWHGVFGDAAPHASGPPIAHTGGFGEPTCEVCHIGAELNAAGGTLRVEGLPLDYGPGERYTVSIVLESADSRVAGFQAAIRFLEGPSSGSQAGRLETPVPSVQSVRDPTTGVEYVQHVMPNETIHRSRLARWDFVWIAPPSRDSVVLHVSANGGNGDNSPLEDLIYTAEARLAPR